MSANLLLRRTYALVLTVALVAIGLIVRPEAAGATAANKLVASGSTVAVLCTSNLVASPCTYGPTAILTGTIKTSSTVGLEITASIECSIATNVTNVINTGGTKVNSSATANVDLWVTISNGATAIAVPVNPNGGPADNGHVTFCNRALTLSTQNFLTQGTISILLSTVEANSFTWFSLPLNTTNTISCNNSCTVSLVAAITGSVDTDGNLGAATITARTLIVEPVNTANTVQF